MPARRDRTAALDQVLELVVLLEKDMTRSLARDGLTTSRAPLVWALHQHGPSTQKALADALGTTPRNVTGLVDALEATCFVVRAAHPSDRRATLVALTDHGAEVMARMGREYDAFADQLFGSMSRAQLDGFVGGLTTVLAVLHAHLDTPAASPSPPSPPPARPRPTRNGPIR
jgi:DNA-binding MarR family transcriptional regulator